MRANNELEARRKTTLINFIVVRKSIKEISQFDRAFDKTNIKRYVLRLQKKGIRISISKVGRADFFMLDMPLDEALKIVAPVPDTVALERKRVKQNIRRHRSKSVYKVKKVDSGDDFVPVDHFPWWSLLTRIESINIGGAR